MGRNQRYKGLQLVQLRSFCLAATQGNFTRAAQALGLSKATVWQQVRALERRLGATFLRRRGRAIELTPEGRLLLEMVQPHLHGLDSLERGFASRRAELPQQLTVAAIPYLLSYHLPPAVQEFSQSHPGVHLNLIAEPWEEVLRLVEQGEADLGVTPYPCDQPPRRGLLSEPLLALQFHLLMAVGHPLARKKTVRLEDVVRYPLIKPQEGSLSHPRLQELLGRQQLADQVRWVMVSRSVDMTRKYVALGVGLALEYVARQVGRSMPDLHLRLLDPDSEAVPVALVVRQFAHLPPALDAFRALVRRHCAADSPTAK